jgi:1-acyl-sn-glycerol-3-phosphate acyltransferase
MLRLVKLLLLIAWIMASGGMAWVCLLGKKPSWRDWVVRRAYRGILFIIGISLQVRGSLSNVRPLLVVSNHVSYLDVVIMGSVFSFRFTPKKDIASWPVISSICRLTGCVFIDRRPEKFREAMEQVRQSLQEKQVISLFPEATTGNGVTTLPFRTGFFHLAEGEIAGSPLMVQPVAVIYTHIRRLPIGVSQWPDIAWYGDMKLVPHLWGLLGVGRVNAVLDFLPPTTLSPHGDRKRLAAHCHYAVTEAIQAARR